MISIRFVASRVDEGLCVLHIKDQGIVHAVILYVDDLLIIAQKGLLGQIKYQMKKRFRMDDFGSISFYLSMNIECNREHYTINIHQHSSIPTIMTKFSLDVSRPVAMTMAMKIHKWKCDEEACNPTIYQSIIQSLLYAMTATRLDVPYAIRVLSQYNHDPSNEHMMALNVFFGTLMASRTGDCISEENKKVHLHVMSIRTMRDARMTINREVYWSSPLEERSTGNRENRSRLPSPWPMPNTMTLE